MNKIGFIGFGSTGSMLIKAFIEYRQVRQEQIVVTRKDKSRLDEIKKTWPEISIAQDAVEVVRNAEYIFICVKPLTGLP
jgi:pyrroline-5-carboxylate reductase